MSKKFRVTNIAWFFAVPVSAIHQDKDKKNIDRWSLSANFKHNIMHNIQQHHARWLQTVDDVDIPF